MDLVPYMYYERQDPGSQLCAQHCLNNMLQQHTYSEFDLAEIAQRLDKAENAALGPANQNKRSYNYNDTGFFSISVLERALEVWDLALVRWRGEAMKPYQAHPEDQAAFVLNLSQHWLPLRRFALDPHAPTAKKRWYNLNSFLPNGPEWISPTYLQMVLEQAEKEGYSVFVVRKAKKDGAGGMEAGEGQGWTDGGIGVLPECMADRMAQELGEPSGRGGAASQAPSYPSGSGSRAPLASANPDQPTVDAASLPPQAGPSSPPARRNRRQDDLAPVSPESGSGFPTQPARRQSRRPSGQDAMDDYDEEISSDDFDMDPTGQQGFRPAARAHYDPMMDEGLGAGARARAREPMDFAMQSRSYDDEDEALQAALKASMQDLPADWKAPEQAPVRAPISRAADRMKAAQEKATKALDRERQLKEEVEAEDKRRKQQAEEEEREEKLEELSPEEIRRRRLAKFANAMAPKPEESS